MQVAITRLLLLVLLLDQTLFCTTTQADQVPSCLLQTPQERALLVAWSVCINHISYDAPGQFQLAPALLGRRICFYIWRDHSAERGN